MERSIRIFPTHAAAAHADFVAVAAMLPQERLDRALELFAHYREAFGEAGQGLARVVRVVPLEGREDLIRNKRATGHTQDKADAEYLERGES
jgi:hypothetical protein